MTPAAFMLVAGLSWRAFWVTERAAKTRRRRVRGNGLVSLALLTLVGASACSSGYAPGRMVGIKNQLTGVITHCPAPDDGGMIREVTIGAASSRVDSIRTLTSSRNLSFRQRVERLQHAIPNYQTYQDVDYRMCVAYGQGDLDFPAWQNWRRDYSTRVLETLPDRPAQFDSKWRNAEGDYITPDTGDVSVLINGIHGQVSIRPGDSYFFSWRTLDKTACQLVSPEISGIDLDGNSGSILPDHPWYPKPGRPTVLRLVCTEGTTSEFDSATVRLRPGVVARGSTSERLQALGYLLSENSAAGMNVARRTNELRPQLRTLGDQLRAAILLFDAYRVQRDMSGACRELRAVVPRANASEYASGIDARLNNYCPNSSNLARALTSGVVAH